MAALDNVSNAVEAALSSVGNGSHALRSFAPGLDFVYLTPLMCVCRAPRNESEAERLSSYFNAHHPHNHKIFNCCGYPDSGTISEATVEAGATGTSTSASPVPPASMLISSRYFESCEDYRGPITLKQLIYCANRAEAYLAANPHGVLVFMCESGAGKSISDFIFVSELSAYFC